MNFLKIRNPNLPPAAQTVLAGAGVGLVAIGTKILVNKLGASPAVGAAPRLSDRNRALVQIGVGLAGGAAIDQLLSMPRVGAAFAAANGALGMEPFVGQAMARMAQRNAAPAVAPPAPAPAPAPAQGLPWGSVPVNSSQGMVGIVQPRRR